jgi:hypothetical protein
MKAFIFIIFCFIAVKLTAQSTITTSTFPVANDSLRYAVDYFPTSTIQITPPGGPYNWNYTSLVSDEKELSIYQKANLGKFYTSVADADLFANYGAEREAYYKVKQNSFEMIAIAGKDPFQFGLELVLRFVPGIIEQRAPLSFPANNISSYSSFVPFSLANVPKQVLDSLKLPFAIDSVRIKLASQRIDFVDAYGTLAIPGGTYPVIREKRTEYLDTRVEAKLPLFGWQDVTDLLLTNERFEGLGKDTVTSYFFWSNTVKGYVVSLDVSGPQENIVTARFKDNSKVTGTAEQQLESMEIKASPNPSGDILTFELKNLQNAEGVLILSDQSGRIIERRQLNRRNGEKFRFDVSNWVQGVYFFKLILPNSDSKSGKFTVIR